MGNALKIVYAGAELCFLIGLIASIPILRNMAWRSGYTTDVHELDAVYNYYCAFVTAAIIWTFYRLVQAMRSVRSLNSLKVARVLIACLITVSLRFGTTIRGAALDGLVDRFAHDCNVTEVETEAMQIIEAHSKGMKVGTDKLVLQSPPKSMQAFGESMWTRVVRQIDSCPDGVFLHAGNRYFIVVISPDSENVSRLIPTFGTNTTSQIYSRHILMLVMSPFQSPKDKVRQIVFG